MTQNNFNLPSSNNSFGPPNNQNQQQLQQNQQPQSNPNNYLPSNNMGTPSSSNANNFGPPQYMQSNFGRPPPQNSFGPPPQNSFGPPPQNSFGPPPQNSFGPPGQSANQFGPPPSNSFSSPPRNQNVAPANTYNPPSSGSQYQQNSGFRGTVNLPTHNMQPHGSNTTQGLGFSGTINQPSTSNHRSPTEGTNEWETSILSVMEMGFQREQAINALRQTNGDVQSAVNFLIDGTLPQHANTQTDMTSLQNLIIRDPSVIHVLIDKLNYSPQQKQFLHQHPEEILIQLEVDLSRIDFTRLAYNPQNNYQMGGYPTPPSRNGQFPTVSNGIGTQQTSYQQQAYQQQAYQQQAYQQPAYQQQTYQQQSANQKIEDLSQRLMQQFSLAEQQQLNTLFSEFPNITKLEIIQNYDACDKNIDLARDLIKGL
ncbi:UV excision repair protein RAD23 B [Tritrichomonas musculus]|uniref:UV excision repair protein RAD23 B n=1 Tax=Tritrichomonas musculus TaxID=1915356 RepID=A0ABR2JTB5_9EUKA